MSIIATTQVTPTKPNEAAVNVGETMLLRHEGRIKYEGPLLSARVRYSSRIDINDMAIASKGTRSWQRLGLKPLISGRDDWRDRRHPSRTDLWLAAETLPHSG